mgnify:CR=1 FL=1
MRNESEIISRKYEINKSAGRAVITVSLSPSLGREPTVTVKTRDVRTWLENKEGIKLGEAIQGGAINNNMSRRLGNNKSVEDLQMTYVFEIQNEKVITEEAPVVKKVAPSVKTPETPESPVAATKPARRTRTSTKSATASESTPAPKKSTRRTRTKKSTTASSKSTTTIKKGDK